MADDLDPIDLHLDMVAAAMAEQARHLDALVVEMRRLREIEEWAIDATHHPGCSGGYRRPDGGWAHHCKCGRRELWPEEAEGTLPAAVHVIR